MTTITTPANFVPLVAISAGAIGTDALPISAANPLPASTPQLTISLSNAANLAAGANTATVAVAQSGVYLFAYILSGTSPSLALQSLSIDGATWNTVTTVTATGQQFINVAAGAGGSALRLTNTGSNSITGLTAALVS